MYRSCTIYLSLFYLLVSYSALAETYIRVNQIGFSPAEDKYAVVMSYQNLSGQYAIIENTSTGDISKLYFSFDFGSYLAFPHHYRINFAQIRDPGVYKIRVDSISSPQFQIGSNLYAPICDSLLRFFQVQRCGENPALLHAPCHPKDATSVEGYLSGKHRVTVDLTGGWHDAGDYVKFTLTTAYTSYLLLLTHEYSSNLIPDRDSNGYSDLLDEAKIGLEWLLKAHFQPGQLLTQVSDLTDHTVGWRLPESDPLVNKRPAYYAPSQAYSASVVAALSIGAARFKAIGDTNFSAKCIKNAITLYNSIPELPSWASGPDSMYIDRSSIENRALAAIELYRVTGVEEYLDDAKRLYEQLTVIHWISWGDLGGIAKIRLYQYNPDVRDDLIRTLNYYAELANKNPYNYPLSNYPWGSAALQSGIAMLAQLFESETKNSSYRGLAEQQRNFLLGTNSHGISFFTGIGSEYPLYPHHQIAQLTKTPLPGALVAGYCSMEQIKKNRITHVSNDRYSKFQTPEACYFDDRNDFLCNEPTISNNAQALFVMAWFASRERNP